jgi:hypothetical protein
MALRKLVMVAASASTLVAGLAPTAAAAHDRGWHHGHRHGYRETYVVERPVVVERPYVVERPVYVEQPVYVERPVPVYRERYVERRYVAPRSSCRSNGTTGLILGGAAGALLGREVDRHGDRAPGTIIGAGAGALVGRELDRKSGC